MKLRILLLSMLVAGCDGGVEHESTDARSRARARATITGSTLDVLTSEPIADVEVEGPLGNKTRSDGAGRFRLGGIPAGSSGELIGRTRDGSVGRVPLRPLEPGNLEVVVFLRRSDATGPGMAEQHR